MCYECKNISEDIDSFTGTEGLWFCRKNEQYYIVIAHFSNEINKTIINCCPWCGRKLK